MNQEFKKEWVAALRSGDYKQGKSLLAVDGKFCCLGVACDLLEKKGVLTSIPDTNEPGVKRYGKEENPALLPKEAMIYMGIKDISPEVTAPTHVMGVALSSLNDNGSTFLEIADLIEAQL